MLRITMLWLATLACIFIVLYTGYRLFGGEPLAQKRVVTTGDRVSYLVASILTDIPFVWLVGRAWGFWE